MLEPLRIKTTILKCLQEIGRSGTSTLRAAIGFDSSELFSATLYELEKRKYIKRDKKGTGYNSNLWSVTKKGENYLIENHDQVVSYEVLGNHFQEVTAMRTSKPKSNYTPRPTLSNSKEANLAMQGISELLQKDQRNTQLLRNLYRQIGNELGMNTEAEAEVEVEQKD